MDDTSREERNTKDIKVNPLMEDGVNPLKNLLELSATLNKEKAVWLTSSLKSLVGDGYMECVKTGVMKTCSLLKCSSQYMLEFLNALQSIQQTLTEVSLYFANELKQEFNMELPHGRFCKRHLIYIFILYTYASSCATTRAMAIYGKV